MLSLPEKQRMTITRKAEEVVVLASIQFARPLALWNFREDNNSRPGCQDAISVYDHEACQRLGYPCARPCLCCRRGSDLTASPTRRIG
jgi:hypothetical protein